MTDTPAPKKRGRPPLGKKAMTPAQRKARQRSKSETNPEGATKEQFCVSLIRDQIPYFVTSHKNRNKRRINRNLDLLIKFRQIFNKSFIYFLQN